MRPRHRAGKGVAKRAAWLLLAVLVLGLGLRVANLVDISNSPFFTRPVIDGQAYDTWAMTIVHGKAPGQPFYQDPLYPYFLALIYSVFGHSYWAVYLMQLLLAVVFLLLVYDTTRRLFDWRAGIAAATIAALYKPLIFYESQIEKTALSVFLTGLFLWLFVLSLGQGQVKVKAKVERTEHSESQPQPGPQPMPTPLVPLLLPLAAGLALGLAALTRANTLMFAPLLPLVLAFGPQSVSRGHRIGAAAGSLVGVLLVIAPVSIRNSILAREFTLTTTQAGQNLYIGNSPYNTTGQYQAPPWLRPNPDFEQSDFAEYANKTAGKTLSHSGVSRFYTHAASEWARSHGREFAKLLWRKTVLYFNNFEVPDNQDMYFFTRYSWVLRLPLLSFGLVFALGLAAMILLARGLSRLSLVLFYFGYAASVIAFFVFSRYRIPALPALLPFAGAMLIWLADSLRVSVPDVPPDSKRRSRSGRSATAPKLAPRRARSSRLSVSSARLAGGVALVLAGFGLTMYPVHHGGGRMEAAQSLTNLASMYFHEGDTAKAIATYQEALKTQPGHPEASRSLGVIMLSLNNVDRALQLFSDAVRSDQSNPSSHIGLGRAYERRGQLEAAYAEFRRAVELSPGPVEYRFELATALQQLNRYPEAIAQYDTMIQLSPENPAVRHNFAVCLYNVGRLDDARIQLDAARRLGGPINPRFDSLLNAGRRPGH